MRDLELRQVHKTREALHSILEPPWAGYGMGELAREMVKRRVFPGLGSDSVYALANLTVRIFTSEFYRDPATGKVSLTRDFRRLQEIRRQAAVGTIEDTSGTVPRDAGVSTGSPAGRGTVPPKAGAIPRSAGQVGTTHAARIHDALEAADV